MRIYTSYFGNLRKLSAAGVVPIGIALWKPKFFKGASLMTVAPTKYMLSGQCGHDEYIRMYREILERQNPYNVVDTIETLSGGNDCALCCYEKPGDFCHRHLLADWIMSNTGIEVLEFGIQKPLGTERAEISEEQTLF